MQKGQTCLTCASSQGHLKVVKLLLEKVSDVNQADKVSMFMFACLCACVRGCVPLCASVCVCVFAMSGGY